ncbi:MAG: glycosyltransferase family 2 protein [Clostridia bacterium]|nr:glycosyltransferase family 2 protein [Clostridia bacterium]
MDNMVTGSIVTFNNMSTIDTALKTLFEFTKDVDFKLFVVDNNSTDGTVEHIKANYPQVEVIEHKKNVGFGAGHNVAINLIDSKYHVVINPDIVFVENSIKKMVEYLDANEDIGILSPKICYPNGKEQILGKKYPHLKYIFASRFRGDEPSDLLKEYAMLDRDLSKPTDIDNATGCFMMFRTSVLKKIGGFDERYFMYFEDADITREAQKISRVVYYPDTVVSHMWNRDSKHNYKLLAIHIHSMLKYYWKWKTI